MIDDADKAVIDDAATAVIANTDAAVATAHDKECDEYRRLLVLSSPMLLLSPMHHLLNSSPRHKQTSCVMFLQLLLFRFDLIMILDYY